MDLPTKKGSNGAIKTGIKKNSESSDRETVEQIRENPYLQYFIGQLTYSNELPFDPSLFVDFRQSLRDFS